VKALASLVIAVAFASLPPGDRFTSSLARQLTYGTARISIPKSHVAGELESPRWYLLEFKEDAKETKLPEPKPIPEREQKMLDAFDIYIAQGLRAQMLSMA